ncbi:methyltransferase domain-containing protein [Roseomonas sp. BN140053]|uniref:methyltransferase domain-containing protein n=1 Tax=Roseomonas sp. BN140053 TaxID=3391898 RepID=UPI0039E81106
MSAEDPLALCLEGRISPEVALARLVLAGLDPAAVAARLDALPGEDARAAALRALFAARREGLAEVGAMLRAAGLEHGPGGASATDAVARVAAMFDRAVARAPEASVAAYSLNDPAILAAATAEILGWLDGQRLIGPEREVLDLGCGTGRVAAALAPRCRAVLGLDVSPGMVAEARRRHAGVTGLRFEWTPGTELPALDGQGFDLVLAVDSFPYLVEAGVAEAQVAAIAARLRPGGALAVLNLSYRGDIAADRAEAARWADANGLALVVNGETPFAIWDGTAFLFRRP